MATVIELPDTGAGRAPGLVVAVELEVLLLVLLPPHPAATTMRATATTKASSNVAARRPRVCNLLRITSTSSVMITGPDRRLKESQIY